MPAGPPPEQMPPGPAPEQMPQDPAAAAQAPPVDPAMLQEIGNLLIAMDSRLDKVERNVEQEAELRKAREAAIKGQTSLGG